MQKILDHIADIDTAKWLNYNPSPMQKLLDYTQPRKEIKNYDLKDVNNLLLKHSGIPGDHRRRPHTFVFGRNTNYRHPSPYVDNHYRYENPKDQVPSFGSYNEYENEYYFNQQQQEQQQQQFIDNDIFIQTSLELGSIMIIFFMCLVYLFIGCLFVCIVHRIWKGYCYKRHNKYQRIKHRLDTDIDIHNDSHV